MKSFTDAQYAFKAAVRLAVSRAGGCNGAADATRVDAARLSRYGNKDAPEFAPIDVCFDLDQAADETIILRAWANLLGLDLVPRNVPASTAADIIHAAGQVAKEFGEAVSAAIEAGPNPSPAVARRVDEEAAEAEQTIINLRKIVRPAMGGRQS